MIEIIQENLLVVELWYHFQIVDKECHLYIHKINNFSENVIQLNKRDHH